MRTITYKCSKALWLIGIFIPLALSTIYIASMDSSNWPGIIPVTAVLTAVAVYYCKQCFTYDFKDKAALLLDNEKLIYYIDHTVIYWDDVTDISYGKVHGQSLSIFFTVRGEGIRHSCVCISTNLIAGDACAIYNDIVERYVKVKRREVFSLA